MRVNVLESLSQIELEDYIAIKNRAYQLYSDYGNDLETINAILTNNLEYELDEPEAILVSSTMLLPDDTEFVELYKQNGYDLKKTQSHYSIINYKNLSIKEFEVKHFHLDKLIEQGDLKPVSLNDEVKNNPKM